MTDLDGVWDVERTGGVLPPLLGVSKRIGGDRGVTLVAGRIGVPFEVRGLELRYTGPLTGFVDVLEPAGADFRGRTTYRGRDIGTFVMRRQDVSQQLKEQLVKHIGEAHAMEQNVLRMLDSMIATTDDEQIVQEFEHHKMETERHLQLLRDRLTAHGRDTSLRKETQTMAGALVKGVTDQVRGDKAGKNARDGFVTEHLEIAAYELLERLARRAGDEETAEVARQIRQDEEAMAQKIASNWDKFIDLTLAEEGIPA